MCSRTLARWILSAALAVMMLGAVLLTLNQVPISQSHPLATDYTVGGTCGATIQACINNPMAQAGDRILIPAGEYHESVTLGKAVSLIGAGANTTIVRALAGPRVMTVTGETIANSVVISGLTFTGGNLGVTTGSCPADCGAGLFIINQARPSIYNVVIQGNSAIVGGGAVYAASGTALTLTNVKVQANLGGVYSLGPVTVQGGSFADNDGTGLYVENDVVINGASFLNNTHGGVWVTGATMLINGWFENNRTSNQLGGGGLLALGGLIASGTVFTGNSAFNRDGGGAAVFGLANLVDCQFINNRATNGGGGGLYANSTLQLNNIQFADDFAEFDGGGLRADGAAKIVNSRFENNVGGRIFGSGGGVAAFYILEITNTQFISNSTAGIGGAIYHGNLIGLDLPIGNGRIVNAAFARNKANSDGAVIYLNAGGADAILHSTLADIALNPRQAIVVMTGTVGMTDTIIASHTIAINQTAGTVYQDYNLFFGNTMTEAGAIINGGHSVNGNPNFASPAIDDFHIISPSAAMGAGVYAGILTDIDNEPRPMTRIDIGADEYWAPGALTYIYLPQLLKNH